MNEQFLSAIITSPVKTCFILLYLCHSCSVHTLLTVVDEHTDKHLHLLIITSSRIQCLRAADKCSQGWLRQSVAIFAVFAHFENNNEETKKKNKDVYFPNEVQRDIEQGDFKMKNQTSKEAFYRVPPRCPVFNCLAQGSRCQTLVKEYLQIIPI